MFRIAYCDIKKSLSDIKIFSLLLVLAVISTLNAVFVIKTYIPKPAYNSLSVPRLLFYALIVCICSFIAISSEQLKNEGILNNRIVGGNRKADVFLGSMIADMLISLLMFVAAYLPYFLIMLASYWKDVNKSENASLNSYSFRMLWVLILLCLSVSAFLCTVSFLYTGNGGAMVTFAAMILSAVIGIGTVMKLSNGENEYYQFGNYFTMEELKEKLSDYRTRTGAGSEVRDETEEEPDGSFSLYFVNENGSFVKDPVRSIMKFAALLLPNGQYEMMMLHAESKDYDRIGILNSQPFYDELGSSYKWFWLYSCIFILCCVVTGRLVFTRKNLN